MPNAVTSKKVAGDQITIGTAVIDIFSGSGATASNEIWSTVLSATQRTESTGSFINTGYKEALNLRSNAVIGVFTLVAQICP